MQNSRRPIKGRGDRSSSSGGTEMFLMNISRVINEAEFRSQSGHLVQNGDHMSSASHHITSCQPGDDDDDDAGARLQRQLLLLSLSRLRRLQTLRLAGVVVARDSAQSSTMTSRIHGT